MSWRPSRDGSRERWLLVALVAAVVGVVFGNGWGRFFSDAQPDLYLAPARVLRTSLSAWLPSPYTGAPNYQSGLAPAAAVSTVLSWFGFAPWVIMRLIRIGLLVAAGAGARALYRDLLDPHSVRGRTAAAVLFVANPYVVVTAASLAIMQPLAGLPWLLLFASRALRGQSTGRNVALVALVFFAMGGENAGVVPIMMLATALPALAVDASLLRGVPLRAVALRSLACVGAVISVSAYWIVPSLSAVGAGSAVAAGTETPEIIYSTSSFAEVLRGLGGWPLYGQDGNGAFQPEFVLYILQPLIVIASFAPVILGLLGAVRGPRRRLVPLTMVVTGLVVAAGAFPFRSPALYGRAWIWAQTHLPGVIAFRTGVKAGGVIVLGLALLGALAVRTYTMRDVAAGSARFGAGRSVVAVGLAVGLVVAVLPMVNGRLFDRSFIIPDYWEQTAARLDQGNPAARVLVLPGQKLFSYRWRRPSADDPLAGLTDRRLVLRTTTPTSTAAAVNFLAAIDQPLERGTQRAGAISAMARYVGVDEVVLRSDIAWEASDGARPAVVLEQLAGDAGLVPDGAYGRPGRNTTADPPTPPAEASTVEQALAPVQLYRVHLAQPLVSAVPTSGGLLVVGDNAAVPSLVDLGSLDGKRPFLLAGSLSAAQLDPALASVSAVVLTDSNQRRVANTSRLANGYGPLLPAATDPGATNALFGATDQSVLNLVGASSITATTSGSIFGPVPFGNPGLAFDSDPSTAWTAGDFGTAQGQAITVRFNEPRTLTRIRIEALPSSPVSLRSVAVTVNGVGHPLVLGPSGVGVLTLPATTATALTVTVTGTVGAGDNAVGIAEIGIAGTSVTPYLRLPTTLDRIAATAAGRSRLAALPLDLLLQRDRGLNLEGRLLRSFDLPDARTFALQGDAAVARTVADPVLDHLLGLGGAEVTSSGRLTGDPTLRGSQAFDADPSTAWVSSGSAPWVSATFTPRQVQAVTLTPASGSIDGPPVLAPSLVRLTFSDGTSVRAALGAGSTTVTFPARTTSSLRVTVLAPTGVQVTTGLASIRLGSEPALVSSGTLPVADRCVPLADLDGVPVSVRTTSSAADVLAGKVIHLVACGAPVSLSAGNHQLATAADWLVDRLLLHSPGSGAPASTTASTVPTIDVLGTTPTSYDIAVGASASDSVVVVGEPFDPRWQASIAGRSLGAPLLANGYALGWRIPAGQGGLLQVTYGPQRTLVLGLVVSAAAVLLAVLLLLMAWRRGRADAPEPASEPVSRPIARPATPAAPLRRRSVAVALVVGAALILATAGPVTLVLVVVCGALAAPWIEGWSTRAAGGGVILVGLTPLAYLAGNLGRWGTISPNLIRDNLLPHVLAGAGVALVTVAIAVEVLGSRPGAAQTAPAAEMPTPGGGRDDST